MSALGNALLGAVLGHSDAEKVFRPWWDSLEDFVIYGLIMLGILVSPTSIFTGTSLVCTQCLSEKQCPSMGQDFNSGVSPFESSFVKSYCTMTSLSIFTMYFPYILLVAALALAGIEMVFSRLFKTNIQIDGFYSLLKHEETLKDYSGGYGDGGDQQPDNVLDNTITTVEVRQSFKNSNSFYMYYFVRTVLEFTLASALAFFMIFFGLIDYFEQEEAIFCDVHGYAYECTGIPQQFYLSVLVVALALLILYLISTFLTLVWLLCPCLGLLARLMRNYSNEVQNLAMADGRGNLPASALMGEMYDIYYNNRDLRLLLDLLAAKSGLALPLRVMAMMDRKFRDDCAPIIHSFERSSEVVCGASEATLDFSESQLTGTVLSKIDDINLLYTVQLYPRTDKNSVEVVFFEKANPKVFRVDLSYFSKPNGHVHADVPRKTLKFHDVDCEKTYTVVVTLVLNGRAVSASQKTLKPVALPTPIQD